MSIENEGQEGSDILQPGQVIRPIMTAKTAKRLVEELYGLNVKSIKEFVSYDDKNYKIDIGCEDISNPNITELWPHGYILKVTNTLDSQKTHIDAQHEAQRKLYAAGIPCTQPVLDKEGRDKSLQTIPHEYEEDDPKKIPGDNNNDSLLSGKHKVRLLTFIPGKTIVNVPYTSSLLVDAGKTAGTLDSILQDYSHPGLTSYETIWNLIQFPKVREFLYAVEDEARRDLVQAVLKAFDDVVLPSLPHCKPGVIHGDYNEQNILVNTMSKDSTGKDIYSISGVIDFGDMTDSYVIFEPAIAIAYMSLDSNIIDPIHVGGHVLAGYIPEMPLNNSEWKMLKECICARYCTSLVMGAYSYKMDPGNEYLLTTAKKGWALLKKLWEVPKRDLYTKWQTIVHQIDPSIPLPNIDDIV